MMHFLRRSWAVLAVLTASSVVLIPATAVSQSETRIVGRVTDTAGVALEGAVVTVIGERLDSVSARTGADGAYEVILPSSIAEGLVTVSARHIGHAATAVNKLAVAVGGSRSVSFRLAPVPQALEGVNVRGSRGSPLMLRSIKSSEFSTKYARDALSVLARYRPAMFGDPDRCPSTDPDDMFRTPRPAEQIERIYVNGVRRDRPGRTPFGMSGVILPRSANVSPAVMAELEDIDSRDIAEIRLADCHDTSVPIDRRNALFVVLKSKPLTDKQRKFLKEIMKPETDSGPPPPPPDSLAQQ